MPDLLKSELLELMGSDAYRKHVPPDLKDHLAFKVAQAGTGNYRAFDAGYARGALIDAADRCAADSTTSTAEAGTAQLLAQQLRRQMSSSTDDLAP